jgi:hypothetical protein
MEKLQLSGDPKGFFTAAAAYRADVSSGSTADLEPWRVQPGCRNFCHRPGTAIALVCIFAQDGQQLM